MPGPQRRKGCQAVVLPGQAALAGRGGHLLLHPMPESTMALPRWILMLTVFALLCALLEGLLNESPAWFVQVCGALTMTSPALLALSALRRRTP